MALEFDLVIANRQVAFSGILILICTCIAIVLYLRNPKPPPRPERSNDLFGHGRKRFKEPRPAVTTNAEWASMRELEFYKELYFKLQNLEEHSDTIPKARKAFLVLLSQALEDYDKALDTNILSINRFDKNELVRFLQNHQDRVTSQYHQYVNRRQSGGPRELFQDQQAAGDWLREIAPLKLVDGAWLGHLNKITMPFALRQIVRQTWQVFTEELGNGNRDQHHVKIFEDLLRVFERDLPSPTTMAILHPRYRLGNLKYWRAAVAQLLVSLFPHDFLPEILGFNMHFESLQLDTMQAAKELPEVGLNAYYFLLHVSIDNGHSGHAAMATESVADYIRHIADTEGEVSAEVAWKRVQAGYIFSEWQSQKGSQATNIIARLDDVSDDRLESKVLSIFSSKIQAAHRLHCGSRVKIGKRSLSEWLDPEAFLDEEWQREFIRCLSISQPWIYPGDSRRSKLAQEFRWGGRMYGAFTKSELETLELWINSLDYARTPFYYSFIEPITHSWHQRSKISSTDKRGNFVLDVKSGSIETESPLPKDPVGKYLGDLPTNPNLSVLLPLWFTQCCLLESFLYSPGRTTDNIGCAVVRFLRAQSGFETEDLIVTGTDEPRTTENKGIVEFGLEMIHHASLPIPQDLYGIFSHWPSEFSITMLKLASSPVRNFGILLGMSMAFLELQETVSESSNPGLLCPKSSERLALLVRRQYQCLQVCLKEIPAGDTRHVDFHRGYEMAKVEINKCFGPVE
ncbi:hypothetical protein EN45_039410 [Penicillium chrysogenum]|jgi:hypothetical protein|uniref:Pc16g09950 protein n=2 Tax=Penicillium chrysogenum species complex TaxID=254878 RepID=B6H964_PENRW|nr:uncharacterized protein N7525_010757 [Penicillium rubens]KAJ5036430.1 hypothetical protein NUH16_004304 [Penicillium rubens]KAJ5821473.1 hypothetical protein N7525_010757 [Penicillium rubens]KZN93756.1 hypothetical protein EN45_039410 [Penicillium chrysogenum]CAP93665.1 Pc16g09950 [Penicillium rubens Wisconsin 54-1255]